MRIPLFPANPRRLLCRRLIEQSWSPRGAAEAAGVSWADGSVSGTLTWIGLARLSRLKPPNRYERATMTRLPA